MFAPDLSLLGTVRNDWTLAEARALLALPFNDLLFHAQRVHRSSTSTRTSVQVSTLLSIKTGSLPRGLRLLPAERALRHRSWSREALMDVEDRAREPRGLRAAQAAPRGSAWERPTGIPKSTRSRADRRDDGARGALAWTRNLRDAWHARRLTRLRELKAAGLDYYNHNLDTSEAFYGKIITTRTYQDRLDTLAAQCATQASRCAAAASWEWVSRQVRTGPGLLHSAGHPAPASGQRSHQPARPGCEARRCTACPRSIPSTSCARSPRRAC
jgi:biotin synthase